MRRVILSAVVMMGIFAGSVSAAVYSGGGGTQTDPYRISSKADWQAPMNTSADWSKYFILTADIDLSGAVITPVGNDVTCFTGVFNGNSYTIGNATINQPSGNYIGLFGYVNVHGQIQNLGLVNVNITGSRYVGGLAGRNISGTISNCYSSGSVIGNFSVGGLAGSNYEGTISNCYSRCSVSGSGNHTGGLLGHAEGGTVSNCFWDIQTSGQTASAGGTGRTTAQMKTKSTFTSAGWDFVNVWHIVENTAYPVLRKIGQRPDFNGDGRTDLLWRSGLTGSQSIWLMDGLASVKSGGIGGDVNSSVVGLGDFNGDGRTDLLWRSALTGSQSIWLMDGLTSVKSGRIDGDLNLSVVGLGDFNGDGRTDLLWRSALTGSQSIWLMDGLTSVKSGEIGGDVNSRVLLP